MAMTSSMFFLFLFAATFVGFSSATVYTVGDKQGWTTIGSPNYTAWAAKETFHVGDTILFVYNKMYHDVVEVNKADYDACTVKSAIAKYATGNDSVTLNTTDDRYFLCSFPGHCGLGQKVEISLASKSADAPTSGSSSPADRKGLGLLVYTLVIVAGAIAMRA